MQISQICTVRDDPAAAELASVCAFLAPEPIPAQLFTAAAPELPGDLAARVADPLAWRQTLAHLARQSLARVDHRGLQMHRLTQAILRDQLTPDRSAQRPALVPGEPVRQRAPRSSASIRAHCCGLSFSRDTGPLDRSAPVPPSRQARCHRRTDPGVTRRSFAMSLMLSPWANRPAAARAAAHAAAARRACTRPVVHTACPGHTPPTSRRHDPDLYEFILGSAASGGRTVEPVTEEDF